MACFASASRVSASAGLRSMVPTANGAPCASKNKALPAGHVLTFDDLESKKPKGYGVSASEFEKVIGKKLGRDIMQWEFLNYDDLE